MNTGDKGLEVLNLQRTLLAVGLKVTPDGWYGPETAAAVAAFQKRIGLVADGEAGPKTLAALLDREVDRKLLRQADIQRAAEQLGVPVASIMAVNAVESCGKGFLDGGRVKILFERHVLYKLWKEGGGDDADALAERYPALINPARGGYAGGTAEWVRLASARQITANVGGLADQSCSWGAFQIMGYHWKRLGYAGIQSFIDAMQESEGAQLAAFVRFIETDPALLKALKSRKWADFARIYNGPAYKANLYDVKLARAFEKFAEPDAATEAPAEPAEAIPA